MPEFCSNLPREVPSETEPKCSGVDASFHWRGTPLQILAVTVTLKQIQPQFTISGYSGKVTNAFGEYERSNELSPPEQGEMKKLVAE